MDTITKFIGYLREALQQDKLSKLTLSRPYRRNDWNTVHAKVVLIKEELYLSCTLKYATRDETKNFNIEEAPEQIQEWLNTQFRNADLFTDQEHWSLMVSKKGSAFLKKNDIKERKVGPQEHDHQKKHRLNEEAYGYLIDLGIISKNGDVLKQGQRKFRQINKYIELIDHLLQEQPLLSGANIIDMGSGKGYLTFALYDFLANKKGLDVKVTGIELRPELVRQCNKIAQKYRFDNLKFIAEDIHSYQPEGGIDMLIALHACDVLTDEALVRGIRAKSDIIVVAPCCHKQVRKDMQVPDRLNPILRNGILLERQAELLTDGLRALLLENEGYKTKVFEFISTEHTPKNVMITAVNKKRESDKREEIDALKTTFGLSEHYLETLLNQPETRSDKNG